MKKGNIGVVLFTGLFVAIVVYLSQYFIPGASLTVSVITSGVSALIGDFIGIKLFYPNKS